MLFRSQAPEAENTWEAVQGAMQGSATGMTVKAAIAKAFGQDIDTGILPSYRMGEKTPWIAQRVGAVAGFVADFPLMIGSAIATPFAPNVGMGAIPAAVRQGWIDYASTGNLDLKSEAWEAFKGGASFWAMGKVGEMIGINQMEIGRAHV